MAIAKTIFVVTSGSEVCCCYNVRSVVDIKKLGFVQRYCLILLLSVTPYNMIQIDI